MKFWSLLLPVLIFFNCNIFSQNDTNAVNLLSQKIAAFDKNHQEDSVLIYAQNSLAISQKINYELGIAKALDRIGVVYMHKGDYPKALDNFFKALPIFEKLQNKAGVLIQYGNIGIIYDNQNDNAKALDYYFKALKISESINDKKHASIQYCNIAIVYGKENDFKKTEIYCLKALEIDKALNDKEGIARNLINIGSLYNDQKKYAEALNYFIEAFAISKEIGDKYQIAGCLVNMASVHSYLKHYKKAEELFLQSLKAAEKVDDLDLKKQIELIVSEFYTELKNDNLAFIHYKKYIVLRDSVYNEENTKKSVKAEMNYSFEKKQTATKFEYDKIVYKLESENKLHKQLQVFFIISIILILGLLFFAKRAYDSKKKIADFMASESNRKEVLLQEVHHRINNNLQIISSLLTLQANSANDEKLTEYLKQSQNRIQSLSALHELLYENDSPLQINMNEYLNKVLDFHRDVLKTLANKVEIKLKITDVSFPTKMAVPLALIVNELVTNSIKYAFNDSNNGQINISLLQIGNEKNEWQLRVSDSGKGLPADNNFRKDSLGLRLVTIMVKQLNGILTKSNTPGATFEILFSV
jgi:two-component sensor histidine kinase